MHATAWRRSWHGAAGTMAATGGIVGLFLAAGSLRIALLDAALPAAGGDLLALVLGVWTLGWVLGPVLLGGSSPLRADHLRLLPIPPLRLALGLLGAAFVGVAPAVTALAFASLILFAVRLGPGPTLVAVPAVLLQLVVALLLSRLAIALVGAGARSRLGGVLTGLTTGAMLVVAQSGWMVIVAVDQSGVLATGFPAWLSAVVRASPSGWGVVAADAADRSAWPLAVAALAGLAAVVLLLLLGWSRLLAAPRTTRAPIRGSAGGAAAGRPASPWRRRFPTGRTAAVVAKELRGSWRDPTRWDDVVVAPTWALLTCLLPLGFGETALLPWAAPATVVMATATAANGYGRDGTALWLTLLTPGATRPDVRGRQWAWLAVVAPMALAIALLLTPPSGQPWAWPWVLALLPALLGGGAGLVVWVAVMQLAPGPDPHRNRDHGLDQGDTTGQGIFTFWAALLPAVPAAAVVLAGTLRESALLRWSGVPIGIGTGIVVAWFLGRAASRTLDAHGPELLSLMRTGRSIPTPAAPTGAIDAMPRRTRTAFFGCVWLGSLALFPQGLVPLGFKLGGVEERVWFLPLYLPGAWQWPATFAMIALGLVLYALALRLYRARPCASRPRSDEAPRSPWAEPRSGQGRREEEYAGSSD